MATGYFFVLFLLVAGLVFLVLALREVRWTKSTLKSWLTITGLFIVIYLPLFYILKKANITGYIPISVIGAALGSKIIKKTISANSNQSDS